MADQTLSAEQIDQGFCDAMMTLARDGRHADADILRQCIDGHKALRDRLAAAEADLSQKRWKNRALLAERDKRLSDSDSAAHIERAETAERAPAGAQELIRLGQKAVNDAGERRRQAEIELAKLRAPVPDIEALLFDAYPAGDGTHPLADYVERGPGKALDAHFARQLAAQVRERDARIAGLEAILNSPETENFVRGAHLEACHQIDRWGTAHDRGKAPADWFWLIGYLAGKALTAHITGNTEKALHHCISSAAALCNWHAAIQGHDVRMCPGKSDIETLLTGAFGQTAVAEISAIDAALAQPARGEG